MAHTHCMLHTQGYKHTLTICNIYCFPTATTVARTRVSVTLYVHCLCCIFWLYQESLHVVMSCKHNNAHTVTSTDCSIKFWNTDLYVNIFKECTVPLSLSTLETVPLSTRERRGSTLYSIIGPCSDIWRISRSVPTSFLTNK